MNLTIDTQHLTSELDRLAAFSDAPPPAVTRIAYSQQDTRARDYVKGLCRAAHLEVREDAVGNLFARLAGSEPDLPPVATGSHIDAAPNSGRYSGTVGVLGGLEAIRALQAGGFQPRRSVELILLSASEPTRFGIGCLGSRLLSGSLPAWKAERLSDKDGKTLDQWRADAGFNGALDSVAVAPGRYAAFIELHIERGPLLEQAGLPLGIVTAMAAPASLRVTVEGESGHAGAAPMSDRRDALCAAAEIALEVEKSAKGTGAVDSVATVTVCDVSPGTVNSVPSRVRLELDVRDIDPARRDRMVAQIVTACRNAAQRRRLGVKAELISMDAPAECRAEVVDALVRAAEKCGLGYQKMVSRAYHDALFLSTIAPTGLLFIPCRGGISQGPEEFAAPEAIAAGALVLAETLAELAG
jgi:N-carbamoyl-L-amino-acid hydrolase